VLPPLQIVDRFGKSRYIIFAMHLDKHYMATHMSKIICPNLPKQLTIWNEGVTFSIDMILVSYSDPILLYLIFGCL